MTHRRADAGIDRDVLASRSLRSIVRRIATTAMFASAVVSALAIIAPGRAVADDSLWGRVLDPTAAAREDAHRRAMLLYVDSELSDGGPLDPRSGGVARAKLGAARDLLERVGAPTSTDARLRYDLGRVLVRLHECDRAIPVLASALTMAPAARQAGDAWFEIGICHALRAEHEEEEQAYLAAIAIEDDPWERAVTLGNLAESRMARGELEAAIDAAEGSLAIRPDNVLVNWTLAVLRDRAGDRYGALRAANVAIGSDPEMASLSDPDVFYQPSYEVHWYRAMGELAWADIERGTPAEKMRLMRALQAFDDWVSASSPTDRWRAMGEARVREIEARLGLVPKK